MKSSERDYYKLKKFINHVINNIDDYEFKIGTRIVNNIRYEFTYDDIIIYKPNNIELETYQFGCCYKLTRRAYDYIIKIKQESIENNKVIEQHNQYEKQSNYFNNILNYKA